MSEKIKLIWDFRGPNAHKTAEHHDLHLKDFLRMNQRLNLTTGVEELGEYHCIAFLIVEKSDMTFFRDRLKPHRGQVYTPNE